ncbi:MAG: amylo-alpha-1,6-glucosidase [Cyanobacteria bacterium P01_G01_bin.54]
MTVRFENYTCSDLSHSEPREWLVTNGIGGYACGTIAGILTRHYHGLLVAALKPPLERTLLLTKLDEQVEYDNQTYGLSSDRWADGAITGGGHERIEQFCLEGTVPVWTFACGSARIEKRVWLEQGANTTYVRYTVVEAAQPLALTLKALVNYRNHHGNTQGEGWQMQVEPQPQSLKMLAFDGATPLYLFAPNATLTPHHTWYQGYNLAVEAYRGIHPYDDHLHVATIESCLGVGESFTLIASTTQTPDLDGFAAWQRHQAHEQTLTNAWQTAIQPPEPPPIRQPQPRPVAPTPTVTPPAPRATPPDPSFFKWLCSLFGLGRPEPQPKPVASTPPPAPPQPEPQPEPTPAPQPLEIPDWVEQLVLVADQFVVDRTIAGPSGEGQAGKTVIAGYPWFGDWGRDTMIALPGLAITTGRPDIAKPILQTFAKYLDQGMLPNLFPEAGASPEYNTVDAILWYFEAVRAYWAATKDQDFVIELFPVLASVIDWHQRGTRYNIHLAEDGLIYAGETGVQLTWMDAKIDDWVVTPRTGKPVEINALWYNALLVMVEFAKTLRRSVDPYQSLAQKAKASFQTFWNAELGYCYDVIDGPQGHDAALRPNQIFAVGLPLLAKADLLTPEQQQAVVKIVQEHLLTPYGLRSLAPGQLKYQGQYGGDPWQRDSSYHQGPVWGWLIGPFIQAHLNVHHDPQAALGFLTPLGEHLQTGCVGTLSEIFDGDAPHTPRGAFAQAWTVAEVLRTYRLAAEKAVGR